MKMRHNLPIRYSLVKAITAGDAQADQKPTRSPKIVHGPKARAVQPLKPGAQPDELLLEVRRLSEHKNWQPAQIAHALGVKKDRVHQILKYQTRAHLVPENIDRPYWTPTAQKGVTNAQSLGDQEGPGPVPPAGPPEGVPSEEAR